MKTVYYAHSMSIYGSKQEDRDIKLLMDLGFEVVNPADLADEYEEWKKIWMYEQGYSPMEFWESKAKQCDWFAFRAHNDGTIPAGVYKEIKAFSSFKLANETRVIELPCGIIRRQMSVAETKEYLRDVGER